MMTGQIRAPPLEPLVKGSISLRNKNGEYKKTWLIQKDLVFGSDASLCSFQIRMPCVLPVHFTLKEMNDGLYIIDHSKKEEGREVKESPSSLFAIIFCNGNAVTEKETLLTGHSSSSIESGEEEIELYSYISFCGKVFRISYFGNDYRRAKRFVLMHSKARAKAGITEPSKPLMSVPIKTKKIENNMEEPIIEKPIVDNKPNDIIDTKYNYKWEITKLQEEIRIEQNLKAKLQSDFDNRGRQILQLRTEKKQMVELINSLVCSACTRESNHICCLPSSKLSQLSALDLLNSPTRMPTKKKVSPKKAEKPLGKQVTLLESFLSKKREREEEETTNTVPVKRPICARKSSASPIKMFAPSKT